RPERRGLGGPPPDRAHAEAVAEGDRLGGRLAEGGGRGAVRQPDASDGIAGAQSRGPDSRKRHERGSRRGPERSGLPREDAARPAAAGGPAPQALRPTNTSSSSSTR